MASKKPKFYELPESDFNTTADSVEGRKSQSKNPRMRRPTLQSEESKAIKRINENMRSLYNYIPGTDNNYIAAYKRAFRDAGIETTKKRINGEEVLTIRNTKENREKVDALRRALSDEGAKTMSDIRKEARSELKAKGRKVTQSNIDEELKTKRSYARIDTNLDIVYKYKETDSTAANLYKMIKGLSRGKYKDNYDAVVRAIDDYATTKRANERGMAQRRILNEREPY